MKNLVCIVCPNGCRLCIDEKSLAVSGNRCPRGEKFARDELTKPMRSLTSTVATVFKDFPVVSVKTDGDVPKDKIFDVMRAINAVRVERRLKVGDVVIENVLGLGVNIVATKNM